MKCARRPILLLGPVLGVMGLLSFAARGNAQTPQIDPAINLSDDPPDLYTLGTVNGTKILFRIAFFPYDKRYNIYQVPMLLRPATPAAATATNGLKPHALPNFDDNTFPLDMVPLPFTPAKPSAQDVIVSPPDPEPFASFPWDLPEPIADYPLPVPPLTDPFNDPYANAADPPLLPSLELDFTDYSSGALQIINSGQPLGTVGARVESFKPHDTTALVTSISIGSSPAGLVRSRDLKTAYVAVSGGGQVAVVDVNAKRVTSTIALPAGSSPYSMALAPDDQTLYVAESASIGSLFAVDLAAGTAKQLPLAVYHATSLVLMPDATRLWVCNNNGDVTVIDLLTNTILAHLPVPSPWAVAFNRTGTRAYITSAPPGEPNGTLEVYDALSYVRLASVPVGLNPHSVGVSPSGRHVFVVNNSLAGSIMQISTTNYTLVRTFPVGDFPSGLGMEH